jgi:hypothetical protein
LTCHQSPTAFSEFGIEFNLDTYPSLDLYTKLLAAVESNIDVVISYGFYGFEESRLTPMYSFIIEVCNALASAQIDKSERLLCSGLPGSAGIKSAIFTFVPKKAIHIVLAAVKSYQLGCSASKHRLSIIVKILPASFQCHFVLVQNV